MAASAIVWTWKKIHNLEFRSLYNPGLNILEIYKVLVQVQFTKNKTESFFGKAQKGKDVLKFRKFRKKFLCKTVPFSLTFQPCSPEFTTSRNTDLKKNITCD